MGFLRRLFAPEVSELQGQLRTAEKQNIWLREQLNVLGIERQELQRELKMEFARNRKREDLLSNQIRELSNGRRLPERIADTSQDPAAASGQQVLTDRAESELRKRALEYAEQTAGENPTAAEIESIYQQMLGDPERWLSNQDVV